jgi:hypothetical protein
MREKIFTLALGILGFTLVSMLAFGQGLNSIEIKEFHPLPAPKISGLILKLGDCLAICGDSITEQKMYSPII